MERKLIIAPYCLSFWDVLNYKNTRVRTYMYRNAKKTIINTDNCTYHLINGKYHKEGAPAIEYDENSICKFVWYYNDLIHREDGPAIEFYDGTKEWWLFGKRHRENGPAVEWSNGSCEWWYHGRLHRDDGPAFITNFRISHYKDGFRHGETKIINKDKVKIEHWIYDTLMCETYN
jgi:hypothetical protein